MKCGDKIIHSSGKRYVSGTIIEETELGVVVRTKHGMDLKLSHEEVGSENSTTKVFSSQTPIDRETALEFLKDMRHNAVREAALVGEGFSNEWMKFSAERDIKIADFLRPLVEALSPGSYGLHLPYKLKDGPHAVRAARGEDDPKDAPKTNVFFPDDE